MAQKMVLQNSMVVTNNPAREIAKRDVLIENGQIKEIAKKLRIPDAQEIDLTDKILIPGFIQTHIHLTQTLFRGQADDRSLLSWLKEKIWPLEAAHTPETNFIAASLGIAELIKSGTTTILDMGTVRYQEEVFQAIAQSGLRAISGKCMMTYAEQMPLGLKETEADSIKKSLQLLEKWHDSQNGRIKYCFAPRFAVSCSRDLLTKVRLLAREYGVLLHTHAAENLEEVAWICKEYGQNNIEYLKHLHLLDENLVLAHCIWLNEQEMDYLAETGTKVAHCPNSNLKLASGIAKIPEMLKRKIVVSLGADGAPCNNNLNMFREMRTAALLQKARLNDPNVLDATTVFEMATIVGARALGLEREIGSIEIGKKADLVVLNLNKVATTPWNIENLLSTIVYAADASQVETVFIDGQMVLKDQNLRTIDEKVLLEQSNKALNDCCRRSQNKIV